MKHRAHLLVLATALSSMPLLASPARAAEETFFIRGDADGSGVIDLSDAVRILSWLFLPAQPEMECIDAADANDDGDTDLVDAMVVLLHSFGGGPAPAFPYSECGADPTPDFLSCLGGGACEVELEPWEADLLAAAPGLDTKPPSGACIALPRPSISSSAAIARSFPNLSLTGIVGMYQKPGDSSRWYVIRRKGVIYSFSNSSSVTTKATVLDLQAKIPSPLPSEGGLLCMAFHPSFASNGQVYIFYNTTSATAALATHISRFVSSDGGATINPNSEVRLLSIDNANAFHIGGTLDFGPDGYLYIGFGESGVKNDAQNTSKLQGSILRINVNSGSPYSIPPDNPYASGGGRPEIYAKGIRQPWRWSFDRITGVLWEGDVGNASYEEVNRIEKGKNYGWPIREGAHCVTAGCSTTGLTDPLLEYTHADGNCVIGGYVYRGSAIPWLQGVYVFGDWGGGKIWALMPNGSGGYVKQLLAETGFDIISFGQGHDGEIYIIEGTQIHKLVPGAGGGTGGEFPALLSETPYVDAQDPSQPAPCMIPYDINVPFWSDGAEKERFFSIPDGTRIQIGSDGDWVFPIGTVFMKTFYLGQTIVETRLFMRHDDGAWAGYSYEWDAAGTDASLLPEEKNKLVGTTPWSFPSGSQCLSCHSEAAGRSLGPETAQMNKTFTYPSTGRTSNQILTYDAIGLFSASPGAPESLPVYPRPTDTAQPLAARARSYLHSNCSHCHRPEGPGRGPADFRYAISESEMGICNVPPTLGDLGVPGAMLLTPGDPGASVVHLRMVATDDHRMPPIGRNVIDWPGTDLVADWIASVTSCSGGATPQTVILDNDQPGTTAVGYWLLSGAPNPFGPNSIYSKQTTASYVYQPALAALGQYDVYLWWTQLSSRPAAVPVDIVHAGGTTTVTVNQQVNGGRWNLIGRWNFTAQPRITIRSIGGSTCADAVKLEPVGAPPPPPPSGEVILDNGAPGTKALSGGWSVSGATGYYGADSIYSKIAGSQYRYIVPLPSTGTYDVYAWWTEFSSRMTNVPIDITHSGGTARVTVNQQTNGGKWNLLGTWSFGTSGTVIINGNGPGSTCADAVRFVKR